MDPISEQAALKTTQSAGLDLVAETVERIVGPVHDRYLACYAVRTKGGYVAYAKVCDAQPECVWESIPGAKITSGIHPGADDALDDAIAKATLELANPRRNRLRMLQHFLRKVGASASSIRR
jgi:hypothetical protein